MQTLAAFIVAAIWSLLDVLTERRALTVAVLLLLFIAGGLLFAPPFHAAPQGSSAVRRVTRALLRILRVVVMAPILGLLVLPLYAIVEDDTSLRVRAHELWTAFPELIPPFFVPCSDDEDITCRAVTVPIDPLRPERGTTRIAIARLPSDGPAASRGTIVVHTGGPLAILDDAVGLARTLRATRAEVGEGFDVVTFDPRGLGWSSADASCPLCEGPQGATGGCRGVPASELFARALGCSHSNRVLATVDEHRIADDLDLVRETLGLEEISLLGISWGARVALAYATRFPHRVDALVLESPARYGRMWSAIEPKDPYALTREGLRALSDDEVRPFAKRLRDEIGPLGYRSDVFMRAVLQLSAMCLSMKACPIVPRPIDRILAVEERLTSDADFRRETRQTSRLYRDRAVSVVFEFEGAVEFFEDTLRIEQGKKTPPARLRTSRTDDMTSWLAFRLALACRTDHDTHLSGFSDEDRDPCGPHTRVFDEELPFFTGRALVVEGTWDARTPPVVARAIAHSIDAPLVLVRGVPHGAALSVECVREHVRALLEDGRVPDGDVWCQ